MWLSMHWAFVWNGKGYSCMSISFFHNQVIGFHPEEIGEFEFHLDDCE
jgi:hypothetical protein